ncbi:hypothetical protein HPB51_014873 [Rhipicephalus microplus]|uniref:Lipase domain-containing protein n=1 Tax=Rhipicephalus microplus TaxID=6941 RepID=A0A9J6DHA2_RHIMP|nr:hypothetical protein HPB51_014873 [Rhipicephalus microplus]
MCVCLLSFSPWNVRWMAVLLYEEYIMKRCEMVEMRDERRDERTDGRVDTRTDARTDGRMDARAATQTYAWIDGSKNEWTDRCFAPLSIIHSVDMLPFFVLKWRETWMRRGELETLAAPPRSLRKPNLLPPSPAADHEVTEDTVSGLPNALPEKPGSIGTRFYLSSRRSREPRLLGESAFNASKPVKLIIHGFGSSGKRSWVHRMVDALLVAGDVNVVVVDWEKGATLPNYVQAAANSRLVGRQVAQVVRRLFHLGAKPRDFHLVGFSLGAHVAGFAGAELRNLSRITGG